MSDQKEFDLTVITGMAEGEVSSFSKVRVSIGRDKETDFFVDDPHASKTNSLIVFEDDEYFLVDNSSTNGTFLNEKQIDREPLKNGDRIKVGETVLEFHCEEEEAEEEADKTVLLPDKESLPEEVTVILPADQKEKAPDPDATVLQPMGASADPNATVLQPLGAPKDPNATQLAPPEMQARAEKKKRKPGIGKFDKAARLRIIIAAMIFIVLIIFAGAFLMPSSKPVITNQGGDAGSDGSQSGGETVADKELASMPDEIKIQKAGQLFELGKSRHDERFLKPGSLYEAIQYFEKAERYLAGVTPKPPIYTEIQDLTLKSKETLQSQFNSLRMEAYMLTKKRQYKDAREKLEAILALVPNPDDERHKLAKGKLNDIRGK